MYSSQMLYLGYISHTLDDPVMAHVEVEQVSDGVQLTDSCQQHFEGFISDRHTWYKNWWLVAQKMDLDKQMSNIVHLVGPQILANSLFTVNLLSSMMNNCEAMGQLVNNFLHATYKYGALANMIMHMCIDHICSMPHHPHPHFGVNDNLIGMMYLHSAMGPWLMNFVSHGLPLWGIWFGDCPMDVKATQQLGDHFSREELQATLEKKGNNIAYHDLCVQLIVEHDCPSPWFITPTSYPGVPLGMSMEDTVFNVLFSNGPTSPSSHMYTSLHQIFGAGPFTPPPLYSSRLGSHSPLPSPSPSRTSSHSLQDSLLGSPVTSSPSPPPDTFRGDMHPPLWPRLFAEPPPTVEQMDAFWNGGEDDDEEEEEEERLPDYVQSIRGELYEDYLAWRKAGFNKLRQAKVAVDEWMAVAARDACDLMQREKDGNMFALDEVKHRLHGAIGKKKKKLILNLHHQKPPTASPHCPPQPASTLLTHITSPGLTPLESTPPEPMPQEPTSQPTHEPMPHKPTPKPTPHKPTPEPTPHEPTPKPTPCKPTPEPAPHKPTHKPAPHEPSPKPTPFQPTPEPTPHQPTPESSPQESFLFSLSPNSYFLELEDMGGGSSD
ncbi:hypothetical protein BS47DRAFT_1366232 [Hydnum rufescens UP504]|uniref:Uncharacterized protein n=1 Tax=Hydnum rufescens UP504 TaxID=1448309 RepID=A0A9P6DR45_9AGAM|nr:hypothetical protein BS47DRAFT_1366232 [Hydnum rufescens UP504]